MLKINTIERGSNQLLCFCSFLYSLHLRQNLLRGAGNHSKWIYSPGFSQNRKYTSNFYADLQITNSLLLLIPFLKHSSPTKCSTNYLLFYHAAYPLNVKGLP